MFGNIRQSTLCIFCLVTLAIIYWNSEHALKHFHKVEKENKKFENISSKFYPVSDFALYVRTHSAKKGSYKENKKPGNISSRYDHKVEKENTKPGNISSKYDPVSNFALYVRTHSAKKGFYKSVFVQSMRYFWTIKAPLVAVLDNTEKDREFGNEIRKVYPFPEICYQDPPFPSHYHHGNGHYGQQLSMFHAEQCFHRKYIGFVDTDTMFITMVTPDQLFIDGKPVIIGQFGSASGGFWYDVSKMTELALGKKEVFRCMSYFPVMMKVKHLVEMREYMAKLHKMEFNSVFEKFSAKPFSQFGIMCTYLWYFHRDEYVFHAQLRPSNGQWHGEYTSPGRHGVEYYKKNVPENIRHPVARATLHYKYISQKWQDGATFRRILKRALCYSGGFDLCPKMCQPFDRTALFREMFVFEFNAWTWDKRCIIAQRNHIANIAKLNKTDTKERILRGCREVDNLPFNLSSN